MRRQVRLNKESDSFDKIKGDLTKRRKLRKRNRKKRILKRFFKIILVILFIFMMYKFDSWEGSRLSKIIVKGNNIVQKEEIIAASGLEEQDRIYRPLKKSVQNKLERHELISSANVEVFRNKQAILINVKEETPVAYQMSPEGRLYFENGATMDLTAENLSSIDSMIILSNINDEKLKKKIVSKISKLEDGPKLAISEIIHTDDKLDKEALMLVMNEGYYVFSNVETLPLLNNYATILSGADPNYKCIYLLEYGPTEDTQVASVKPCEFD